MKEDNIQLEILQDGTLRFVTDKISSANHKSADDFLTFLARECGGQVDKQKRHHGHTHAHEHEHQKGTA